MRRKTQEQVSMKQQIAENKQSAPLSFQSLNYHLWTLGNMYPRIRNRANSIRNTPDQKEKAYWSNNGLVFYLLEKAELQICLCCKGRLEGASTQASRLGWELARISHFQRISHLACAGGQRKRSNWVMRAEKREGDFVTRPYHHCLIQSILFISCVMNLCSWWHRDKAVW